MHGHNTSLVTFEVALKFHYIIETEQVCLHSYSKLFKNTHCATAIVIILTINVGSNLWHV